MIFTRTSGIIIPIEYENYEKIKKDLTIKQKSFFTNEIETLKFYEELNNAILIPRYYPGIKDINNECNSGFDIQINSKISLRNKTQEEVVEYLTTHDNGIIKALPGIGKTVCAIEMICRRKKKTLIIVHKKELLKQWKKEILDFTDITEEQIGIITTQKTKYKKELDKSIILSTPHVIGLAVKNKKYDFLQYLKECGIGVLIGDEIHSIAGAEIFSKSCITIDSKVNFGLSATPERPDETNKIIGYHFGNIVEFAVSDKDTIKPMIYIIKSDFEINKNKRFYINYGGKFNLCKYSSQAKISNKYNNVIMSLINKCYNEKRNTLIVGNYIKPLLYLAENSKIEKKDIGFFLPTANKKDILKLSDTSDLKEAFLTKQMVFATYQAVRDGNNRPDLDAAIMVLPTNNPVQLIGRLTRVIPNKRTPIVFDIVDTDKTIPYIWNSEKTIRLQKFEKTLEDRIKIYDIQKWSYTIIQN